MSPTTSPDFAPISSDEMAFALTFFVEAANRRISSPVPPPDFKFQSDDDVCDLLFQILCSDIASHPAVRHPEQNHQTTLYEAFNALCSHYEGDPLQAAVCARVLAFYFLMERSAGATLAEWVEPHPETPQYVSLDPAVIEAIATVRLRGSVLLSHGAFLELVAEKAASPNRD